MKIKRLVSLALCLILMPAVVGCGNQSDSIGRLPTNQPDSAEGISGDPLCDELICDLPNETFKIEVIDGKLCYSLIMGWPVIRFGAWRDDVLFPVSGTDEVHQILFRLFHNKPANPDSTDCLPDYYMLFEKSDRAEEYGFRIHPDCGTVQVFVEETFLCDVKLSETEMTELLAGLNTEDSVSSCIDFTAQYIRTNGYVEGEKYPKATWITSPKEFQAYYEENKDRYDLDTLGSPGTTETLAFLDALASYDEYFFESRDLIVLVLEEPSGSVRHRVREVRLKPSPLNRVPYFVQPVIERVVPEVGTDDMAEWHILIAIGKEYGSFHSDLQEPIIELADAQKVVGSSPIDPKSEPVVTAIHITSLPGFEVSERYYTSPETVNKVMSYLHGLHLEKDFPENPDEYGGQTWVVELQYYGGLKVPIYLFGNMFYRSGDSPWMKMDYDEACEFDHLIYENPSD